MHYNRGEVTMATENVFSCEKCTTAACRFKNEGKYPKFCLTANSDKELVEETINIYKEDKNVGDIARISASIEGEFYGRYTRVEETVEVTLNQAKIDKLNEKIMDVRFYIVFGVFGRQYGRDDAAFRRDGKTSRNTTANLPISGFVLCAVCQFV